MNDLAIAPSGFDLSPRSLDEAMRLAGILADSSIVPKDFIGKPGNVLVAIQWGMELGLKPMQAMQNIAVINGRPSLWGDAVLALVLASPVCEYVQEWEDGGIAYCKVKRVGKPEDIQSFGDKEAKQAGLSGKQGPWTQYPQRMKKMRARSFALRDNFADVLKGIPIAEEVMDIPPEKVMGKAEVVKPEPSQELCDAGKAAALKGLAAYQKFWKDTGADNRKLLANDHEEFKQIAAEADEVMKASKAAKAPLAKPAETVPADTPSSDAAPAVDSVLVYQSLQAAFEAKDVNELQTAADMIGSVEDPKQRSALTDEFNALKATLENEA